MIKRGEVIIFDSKKAQVWVETVIYTLIALVIIGAVVAFANPQIEKTRDNAIIEQSISTINSLDQIILSTAQGGPGNKRIVDMRIREGEMTFNSTRDKITFFLETRSQYSEPGEEVNIGNVVVRTKNIGEMNELTLTRSFDGQYNITYQETEDSKKVLQSSTLYRVSVENKGKDINDEPVIDISVT